MKSEKERSNFSEGISSSDELLKMSIVTAVIKTYGVNGDVSRVLPGSRSFSLEGLLSVLKAIYKSFIVLLTPEDAVGGSAIGFIILGAILFMIGIPLDLNLVMVVALIFSLLGGLLLILDFLIEGRLFKLGKFYKLYRGTPLFKLLGVNWNKSLKSQKSNLEDMFHFLKSVSRDKYNNYTFRDVESILNDDVSDFKKRERIKNELENHVSGVLRKMKLGGDFYYLVEDEWDMINLKESISGEALSKRRNDKLMDIVMEINKSDGR